MSAIQVKALVFDMDGTILHTLPDLALAANEALGQMGFPQRSYGQILSAMGSGGGQMIQRIMPDGATREQWQETFELWRRLYINSDYAHTKPFPGVVDVLERLRDDGIKTAILSNKFDAGVRVLAKRHFPGLFDAVCGDRPPNPRKPDPTMLLRILEQLDVRPSETAYVGDTPVDVHTARNAGTLAIGVSWGYAKTDPLRPEELDAFITSPTDLLTLPNLP